MNRKYIDLSKNIGLFTICKFGQRFLSFFLVPVYTNFLTTGEYGTIDIIVNIVSLLIPIITIGISSSVMRFTMQNPKDNRYLSYGFTVSFTGLLILCMIGAFFSFFPVSVLGREYYVLVVMLGACYIFYNLFTDYLRGIGRVSLMVLASAVNTLVNLVLNIVFIVIFNFGIYGYILGNCCGMVSAVILVEFREKIFRKRLSCGQLDREEKREVINYSVPLIISSIAWWINSSLDRFFIVAIKGASDNGIYSVAYKIPNILASFEQVFSQAWLLSAVKEYDKDDKDGYFANMFKMYNSIMTMICAIIILFNILLSRILYAKEFYEAWKCVPILLLATLFLCLKTFWGVIFTAVKNTKISAFISIFSAAVNTLLNLILIPKNGVLGAGIATFISYFSIYMISLILSRKYIDMKINYIKEEVAHVLILIQAICATTASHLYVVQIIVVLFLFVLFYERYIKAVSSVVNQFKLKIKKN